MNSKTPVLHFAAREDGLVLGVVGIPDFVGETDRKKLLRALAHDIKTEAFGHYHHHHLSPERAAGRQGSFAQRLFEFVNGRLRTGSRNAHQPVRTQMPVLDDKAPKTLTGQVRAFRLRNTEKRIEALSAFLRSDEKIGELIAIKDGGEVRALHLLDSLIAKRHDEAVRKHDMVKYLRARREKRVIFASSLMALIVVAAPVAWFSLALSSADNSVKVIVSGLIFVCAFVAFYGEADERARMSVLSSVRSHLGYLNRANDFATILQHIYRRSTGRGSVHASPRGYDSLIGSLGVLADGVSAEAESARHRNHRLIAIIGALAAIIALLGARGGT